jgi:DNA-binding transcriptional regulator YdaS (Cro superfamily)
VDQERLTPFEAFDLAVTRAGGQSALARIWGCTPGNINQLLQKKSQVPAEYVLPTEAATGVLRHDLRPDIYPRGLQDDVPFRPAVNLGDGDGAVADETRDFLQPDSEWPIDGDDAGGKKSQAAA